MAHSPKNAKNRRAKTILRLPDLEHSKRSVLNSLASPSSQDSYEHAIDEFIGWYCSEPRLSFSRTVVLRYRFFLEQKSLAPSTINVRLAAVRRLAYEAADTGLLSPELAAGIRRVKGAKRLGVRIGNWLTLEQVKILLRSSGGGTIRAKRDRAILALLVGCGFRRAELVGLKQKDFQIREDHWVVADLIGKGKHIRTVPVPNWAKQAVDDWLSSANIEDGFLFRRVNRFGRIWGSGITPKAIWHNREGGCEKGQPSEPCPSRFAPNLRATLPHCWGRVGADSVPSRSCFSANDRALLRLQAEDPPSR